MKRTSNVILIIISAIIAIFSLAFLVIEARLVLSFDWTLHEHEFLGFIQYMARLGISALCLATSISSIVYINKKSFILEGACIFAVAIATAIGATNGIGLYLIIAATVYLASAVLHYLAAKREEE